MADWSGTLTPEISTISNGWKVVIPAGIGGSEWQGQTHFTLDAPASAAKKYDFCVTLNSSAACTCTVKLAWEGNDKDHAFFSTAMSHYLPTRTSSTSRAAYPLMRITTSWRSS